MRHSKKGTSRVHEIYDALAAAHKRKLVVNETNTSEIANAAFKARVQSQGKNRDVDPANVAASMMLRTRLQNTSFYTTDIYWLSDENQHGNNMMIM